MPSRGELDLCHISILARLSDAPPEAFEKVRSSGGVSGSNFQLARVDISNLLMCGPPGAGKSLLASCLPGILPPLDAGEALGIM